MKTDEVRCDAGRSHDVAAAGTKPVPVTAQDLAADPELLTAVVALNNDHAIELSWADEERMLHLIANAYVAERLGSVEAMLIAFDQDAEYDSANFRWFRGRYAMFVYIDRDLGFAPVGSAHLGDGKTVTYLELQIG